MHEVIMPKLGLTMESGKIEKWHKKEGDKVKAGEVLFEVMTDKVTIEVESYNSGILRKILRVEGEEVPVIEVVAYIGEEDEEIPQAESELAAEDKKKVEVKKAEEAAEKVKEVSVISGEGAKISPIKISPLARKTAKETKALIVTEEHSKIGDLSSAVSEVLVDNNISVKMKRIGINDVFGESDSLEELKELHNLNAAKIVKVCLS